MSITRRLFLRNTAAAGAAATVAAPVIVEAAAPEMTARELAIWHMHELERLILATGAKSATIIACGHDYPGLPRFANHKGLALHPGRELVDRDGMFAEEGAAS